MVDAELCCIALFAPLQKNLSKLQGRHENQKYSNNAYGQAAARRKPRVDLPLAEFCKRAKHWCTRKVM